MTRRLLIGLALLVVACATYVAATPSVIRGPSVVVEIDPCLAPTDTSRISITWAPVLDRRGAAVARYEWLLLVNGTQALSGNTTANSTVGGLICPAYGDSAVVTARVRAVDTRGNAGQYGTSNSLVIRTVDPGPPAPVITIDTIAALLDSITFDSNQYSMTSIGDTLELACEVKLWRGGLYSRAEECIEANILPRDFRLEGLALLVYGR